MTYLEFPFKDKTLKIDSYLADTLASVAYNVEDDWDVVILVTGNRTVRTGKSVMAMTIAAFIAYLLKKLKINEDAFKEENIFFDGAKMLDKAQSMKYSVIVMDEARESLAASKSSMQMQQSILDFFTECGQLRNIFIVVLPDFFDLKEMIAIPRSEFLVNVYREDRTVHKDYMGDGNKRAVTLFGRGFFKLYNRHAKTMMYDFFRTTRRKDYHTIRPSFPAGRFQLQYPFEESKYREMKKESLERFKERQEEKAKRPNKRDIETTRKLKIAVEMMQEKGIRQQEIADRMDVGRAQVAQIKRGVSPLFDKKKDTGFVKVN